MTLSVEDWDRLENKLKASATQLEEGFTRVYNKIDGLNQSLSDQNKVMGCMDTAMKSLYGRVERHDLDTCQNITRHYKEDHKGYTIKIIGMMGGIVVFFLMVYEGVRSILK